MLKPAEKAALANWWHYTGRPIFGGAGMAAILCGVPVALLTGFTVN